MAVSIAFAFIAGILSTLSPCVLPLLPVILGASLTTHRFGPVAMAAGLALSFVAIGMFVATVGFSIGLDSQVFRTVAGLMLIAIGVVLVVPPLQTQLAGAGAPVSNWAQSSFGGFDTSGLGGQFALGLLLGAVWSPCVGPTLGAASVLASQGQNLGEVALVMAVFGLGAAAPLLALGFLSREAMLKLRGRLAQAGRSGKAALGVLLLGCGLLIVSGLDKRIEALVVAASPEWLTHLTTKF